MNATSVLKDEEQTPDALDRAVRLVGAARSFYTDLLVGQIGVDCFRDAPLEMGQYRNLFSTCLYPRGMCFEIYKPLLDAYIVVTSRGWYFKVDLPLVAGQIDRAALRYALEEVVAAARALPPANSPGAISAAALPPRTAGLITLRSRAQNRVALDTLANAFLVLCLDLASLPTDEEQACRLAQCGNLENRWHLASQQIVVFGNSKAAIVFSYVAGIDGNVMMRYSTELRRRALNLSMDLQDSGSVFSDHLRPLHWQIPSWVDRQARSSAYSVLVAERALYRFSNWSGSRLTASGFRLDAIFNVALLMAAQKLAGRRPHYIELLTMAKYRNCGLGNAMPWSPAISQLVDPALNPHSPEAATALQAAVNAHAEALRHGRKHLNIMDILSLQLALAPAWRKPVALFTMLQFIKRVDVIVSSPRASEEIDIVGRLGVALPVNLFSLHYEIHDEDLSLAFMPGQSRPFSNAEIAAVFKECLDRIVAIATQN